LLSGVMALGILDGFWMSPIIPVTLSRKLRRGVAEQTYVNALDMQSKK